MASARSSRILVAWLHQHPTSALALPVPEYYGPEVSGPSIPPGRHIREIVQMLTLFSYPGLFGVADNNPYGLKVFAFLRLCGMPFRHEHIVDTNEAPRGQLPYLLDGEEKIGDSDAIIAHLIRRSNLRTDEGLSSLQRDTHLLVRRALDDLYWVMSYSRWKDDRFWPAFRDAFLAAHPSTQAATLDAARDYNFKRYYYQGIGRFEPEQAYARGLADLEVLASMVPSERFVFGASPCSLDAAIYGFIANIHFFEIDTPLRRFVQAQPNLVEHCHLIHARTLQPQNKSASSAGMLRH
jgi:glutathione S-transferase